jgi:hypothetical protein
MLGIMRACDTTKTASHVAIICRRRILQYRHQRQQFIIRQSGHCIRMTRLRTPLSGRQRKAILCKVSFYTASVAYRSSNGTDRDQVIRIPTGMTVLSDRTCKRYMPIFLAVVTHCRLGSRAFSRPMAPLSTIETTRLNRAA